MQFDSRVLRNKDSQTPPDPEGSNGSDPLYVPQGCLAIFFLKKTNLANCPAIMTA